jgi:hypothetical protein
MTSGSKVMRSRSFDRITLIICVLTERFL